MSHTQSEHKRFEKACELMPPDTYWGDPITVDMVLDIASAARAIAPQVPATENETSPSRIFRICDAYESGMGHGLKRDKHSSGCYSDVELNEAYETGYKLGEKRSALQVPAEVGISDTERLDFLLDSDVKVTYSGGIGWGVWNPKQGFMSGWNHNTPRDAIDAAIATANN